MEKKVFRRESKLEDDQSVCINIYKVHVICRPCAKIKS